MNKRLVRWNVAYINVNGLTCSTQVDGTAKDAFGWLETKIAEAQRDSRWTANT